MAEYIDKEATIFAVKGVIGNLDHECKSMMDFYSALWSVPAADVAPVVHGMWVDEDFPGKPSAGNGIAICSVCGEMSHKAEHGYPILSKYCPNCGAKMDGGAYVGTKR